MTEDGESRQRWPYRGSSIRKLLRLPKLLEAERETVYLPYRLLPKSNTYPDTKDGVMTLWSEDPENILSDGYGIGGYIRPNLLRPSSVKSTWMIWKGQGLHHSFPKNGNR